MAYGSPQEGQRDMKAVDPEWRVHRMFCSRVKQHLNENGKVLFCEDSAASSPDTFRPMIEAGGLRIERVFRPRSNNLYLLSMLPLWLKSGLFQPFRFLKERRLPLPLAEPNYSFYFVLSSAAER